MKTITRTTPNILLNYLQSTNTLVAFDISNFIDKTQILKFYESVVSTALSALVGKAKKAQQNFNNAPTRAGKGTALNPLNKYPTLQNLIRLGADLDSSQELKDLEQLYNDEPLRLLNAQILEANNFIKSEAVQKRVTLDFDSANYHAFDVNNGDNNCQSRIFLMDIFEQSIPYAKLTSLEQGVLTLSNITSQYNKEIRDVFGLLIKEVGNSGAIKYGSCRLLSVKVPTKIDLDVAAFYSVSDLMSQAISQISCGYLLAVADTLGDADLKLDLAPYARKMQNSDKVKPMQQLQAPGIVAMYACIELKQYPLAYKITRLTTTALNKFMLQDVALLDINGDKLVNVSNSPAIIFELYSVEGNVARSKSVGTSLQPLASATTFTEYLSELKAYGVPKLMNFCDINLDKALQQRDVAYSSAQLNVDKGELAIIGQCLSGCYATGKSRSTSGVLFVPCHVYINSTANELAKLQALVASKPEAGLTI